LTQHPPHGLVVASPSGPTKPIRRTCLSGHGSDFTLQVLNASVSFNPQLAVRQQGTLAVPLADVHVNSLVLVLPNFCLVSSLSLGGGFLGMKSTSKYGKEVLRALRTKPGAYGRSHSPRCICAYKLASVTFLCGCM
jgi:hypothetical protein